MHKIEFLLDRAHGFLPPPSRWGDFNFESSNNWGRVFFHHVGGWEGKSIWR